MSNEWVMVPREPTANQLVDGAYEVPDPISHRGELTARMVYRAMLDAAPQQAEPAKPAPWPAEPDRRQPYLDLQSAWSCADQRTMAGSIIGRLVNELRILRERVDRAPVAAPQQAEPAIAIEVTQDADGTWSLTVPTYFPCMPVGKHDLYLHPPAAEVQRLRDAAGGVLAIVESIGRRAFTLDGWMTVQELRRALKGGE